MKRIFKKSLSLALSLALLFSVAPISFAENRAEAPAGTELVSETEQVAETDSVTESEADTDAKQVTESEQGEASAEEKSEVDDKVREKGDLETAEEKAPEPLEDREMEPGAEFDNNIGSIEFPEQSTDNTVLFRRKGDIQPGELSISKVATPSKKENIWDIELNLTGKNVVQSTDIVLLIDSSGSMNYDNRLGKTKLAAKNFIEKELTDDTAAHTRIAVVSFSANAIIQQNLTNDTKLLNLAIDKLNAEGGTHTQAGLRQAELILNSSTAGRKVIVLLSDGIPTYSYDVKNGYEDYTEKIRFNAWQTSTHLPYDLVDFTKNLGEGRYLLTWKEGWAPFYYVHHGNVAIVLANHIREQGYLLYTIGLSLDGDPRDVMMGIGKGNYYDADSQSLDNVYQEIAGKINYAASKAIVKDPMGPMFEIVDSSAIRVLDKDGNALPGAKVTWKEPDGEHPSGHFVAKLGTVSEKVSPIKIKYQVKIKDKAVPGTLYPTNGETTVTYTDSNGKEQVKKFEVPRVGLKAASIKVYALFADEQGNLLKTSETDFGAPALDKLDQPLSVSFYKDKDKDSISLELKKEYTVTAEPFFKKTIGGKQKNFALVNQVKKVKGTALHSQLTTNESPYRITLSNTESKEVYFVYKLQEKAKYKVKHILQDSDGNYDSTSAMTETIEGMIGELTEAKAKTGIDGGIDYDYYTPLRIMQKTIEADGSTEIEIHYARNYVTLTANSDTKTYDGNEQTVEGYTAVPAGETFDSVSAGAKGTDAGEYPATFQEEKEKLEAKSGKKYFAKYQKGKLVIEKADNLKDSFKLDVNGYTGVYDGATHEPEIKGDLSELMITHSKANANDWKVGLPSIKDVSEQAYDIKFTHKNYLEFVAEDVLLKVTPKKASITAGSKSKVYDGIALTENSFTTADFVPGEGVASAVLKGSITEVGSIANTIDSYQLTAGTLATNYEIKLINGTLTVTAKKIDDTNSSDSNRKERHSIVTTDSNDEETETIRDDQTPLAKLNSQDHFAYLSGYPDGSFRPHDALTREQVAAIFFRLLDKEDREKIRSEKNDFSDVNAQRWSNKHISTLSNGKIFSGYADGSFKPDQSVTRAELALIASKFDKLETDAEHTFTDIKGHWAEKYIASAVKKGWINSYKDNTFRPEQSITRAEFVSFVNNVLNRHVKLEDILEPSAEFSDVTEKTAWYYCPIKCATNSYLFEESKGTENATIKYQKWTKLTTPIIEM